MIRRSTFLALMAVAATVGAVIGSNEAAAQNESILAEVYGLGVHSYYAGNQVEAHEYFTTAIDGGTRDPRAYYFRGIVESNRGNEEQAVEDWKAGAEIEAAAGGGYGIGQALSRFQGSARLKLESIRQKARLTAALKAATRSDIRMNELKASSGPVTAGTKSAAPTPAPAAPAAPAVDNPFADDGPALAGGEAKVESDNALDGLDGNPFADDKPADAVDDADAMAGGESSSPFGGSDPAADTGADPFGNDGTADPFGAPAGGEDPFGGSPF